MSTPEHSSEHARIKLLRSMLGAPQAPFEVTIGDDCAVVAPIDEKTVWSVDAAVEDTHFRRDLMSLEDAGYRATMSALSDLAAMGAAPIGILAGLILPRETSDDEFAAILRGQRAAADEANAPLVGGNMARGDLISITTTVVGKVSRAVLRSGANVGDEVFVAGQLGFSGAGFAIADVERDVSDADFTLVERALAAFRRPKALLAEGQRAAEAGATSMIDVSDGLASDAAHIANDSNVTIVFEEGPLLSLGPPYGLARLAGQPPLDLVLAGGEDYALVCTAPAGTVIEGFVRVGRCVERKEEPLALESPSGLSPINPEGFDHFGEDE